jgi:hypothetical protein
VEREIKTGFVGRGREREIGFARLGHLPYKIELCSKMLEH